MPDILLMQGIQKGYLLKKQRLQNKTTLPPNQTL